MTSQQFQLEDSPNDGITNVCFSAKDSRFLIASSWDKTLRLYNVTTNRLVHTFDNEDAVLDCCFGKDFNIFSGGTDNTVLMHDLETQTDTTIGKHSAGVRCVEWSTQTDALYTGSWDASIKVWDPRGPREQEEIRLPQKVFSMDLLENKLAVAMAERHIHIYDIRNMGQPLAVREATLNYMLKCIRLMPEAKGFACSSIEGRVMLDYFEDSQDRIFTFKLHRQNISNTELVYPVNALAFHPKYGTFASGGSDCVVNVWDGVRRKRVKQFNEYPEEIACLNFNHDGTMLAIASSYTFDEGEREQAPDTIFIRNIQENEVKPRVITT